MTQWDDSTVLHSLEGMLLSSSHINQDKQKKQLTIQLFRYLVIHFWHIKWLHDLQAYESSQRNE